MIKSLQVSKFTGVPYLGTSSLMTSHGGKLKFSTKKPNVIVGPNGTGKSALLTSLAMRFLAHLTGESRYSLRYTSHERDSASLWSKSGEWRSDWEFMKGFAVDTDNAPALYYRPNHIPGNEDAVVNSMMCGYFEEAKAYARLTEKKSSGQKCQALLDRLKGALAGTTLASTYQWEGRRAPVDPDPRSFVGDWVQQTEALKKLFANIDGGIPLLLLDEPEQSLDALAEAQLWKAIASADCNRMQVIVATHSLHPILNPRAFNVISTEPGYADKVREELSIEST